MARMWTDPWAPDVTGPCSGCGARARRVMVIEGIGMCGPCHADNQPIWRQEEREEEQAAEAHWAAVESVIDGLEQDAWMNAMNARADEEAAQARAAARSAA